ncbi:MAG: tRNA (adenosine(37)-N6)-threonylcarbamoyltransferase complex transferase subunit TsaD [bacterium]
MKEKKINKNPLILSIDTSCDETSAAVMYGLNVLSNVISSQIELHKKYGGVVPLIAKRAHEEQIDPVIFEALKRAGVLLKKKLSFNDLDAIAVTYGPGLAIALEIGVEKAKKIATEYGIPLIKINHMEGHFLASLARNSKSIGNFTDKEFEEINFPILGVLLSGGHSEFILAKSIGEYEVLGQTLDDAMGEAYDKVARILGLGYPGGKTLSEFAKKGTDKFKFTIPMRRDKSFNMSFSGIKTAVMFKSKELKGEIYQPSQMNNPNNKGKFDIKRELSKQDIYDLARSFEEVSFGHLKDKFDRVLSNSNVKVIFAGGGVVSNSKIRKVLRETAKKHNSKIYFPRDDNLYMDNAAMIGTVAFFRYLKEEFVNPKELDRDPEAKIDE